MIWSYVKIAAVSSHIIFHKKTWDDHVQEHHGVLKTSITSGGLQSTQQGPLFSEQPTCCLSLHSVPLTLRHVFFSSKMSKTMVGQTIIFPSFWVVLSLVLCVLISCPNTFWDILSSLVSTSSSVCWGRHRRFLKDIGIVPQIILDGIDLDELPNHKTWSRRLHCTQIEIDIQTPWVPHI